MNVARKYDGIFIRFSDLTRDLLNCDMHIHTVMTDGKASAAEIIAYAEEIGLSRIAITEHVRADSEWFCQFVDDVRKLALHAKIQVFVGAEARILDYEGGLDITERMRRECDLVLGSVHRFPDSYGRCLAFSDVPPAEFAQREFDLALGFVRHGGGDVLAHPGGMSSKFGHEFPTRFLRQLMHEASSRGVAIELNSCYNPDVRTFCMLAAEENPLISIGSDVHNLHDLGHCRDILKEAMWNNYQ